MKYKTNTKILHVYVRHSCIIHKYKNSKNIYKSVCWE